MDTYKKEVLENKQTAYMPKKNNTINQHPILSFFIFLLLINKFGNRGGFSKKLPYDTGDEFVVDMEKNPAFPLEKINDKGERVKKSILNVNNSQDFLAMIEQIKPYMDAKNQYILTIFDRWRNLLRDMDNLSHFDSTVSLQEVSPRSSGDIINLLQDLKPFIHEDYHQQIVQFSSGIESMIEIQKNIHNLQNTLTNLNHIKDNSQKINNLINAIEPFMSEEKTSAINQFKSFSQVMDVMKMVDSVSQSSNQSNQTEETGRKNTQDKKANFMELLDLLDSPPKDKPTPPEASIQPPPPENISMPIEDERHLPQVASLEDVEDREDMPEFIDAIEEEHIDTGKDQS